MRQQEQLPSPPATIFGNSVALRFSHTFPGNAEYGQVRGYHFRIIPLPDGRDAGHINLRIGDTPHIQQVVGHIGYEVIPALRGNGYAEIASRALAPFAAKFYDEVILTADPMNAASLHIIENLGARFLDEVAVPQDDIAYQSGAHFKRRYLWDVRQDRPPSLHNS
ncbi:MAG: putative acetyltransferase [Verrucomicrobiales bacterium]|jgi:predicted acetyltransferase